MLSEATKMRQIDKMYEHLRGASDNRSWVEHGYWRMVMECFDHWSDNPMLPEEEIQERLKQASIDVDIKVKLSRIIKDELVFVSALEMMRTWANFMGLFYVAIAYAEEQDARNG